MDINPQKILKKLFIKYQCFHFPTLLIEKTSIILKKKILNFLSQNNNSNISYTAEPKIDGISASLTYLNGKLKFGLSRGDGKGEDITLNLRNNKRYS